MSVDFLAVQKALRAWTVGGSGLPLTNVYWGQQDSQRVAEPAIEMRIYATNPVGLSWLDTEPNFIDLPPLGVTTTAPLTSTLTAPNHGLGTGDGPFHLATTGVMPAGLSPLQDYWAIALDLDTFQLSLSYADSGGADIGGAPSGSPRIPKTFTDAGSGSLSLRTTPLTTRGGSPIRYVARAIERLAMILECHTSDAIGMQAAMSLLNRVKARQRLPSQFGILDAARLGLTNVERARALHGTRNAVLFEPRASMECIFSVPSEEVEYAQSIERVAPIVRRIT